MPTELAKLDVLSRTDATPELASQVVTAYARKADGPVNRYVKGIPTPDLQREIDRLRRDRVREIRDDGWRADLDARALTPEQQADRVRRGAKQARAALRNRTRGRTA